MAPRGEVVVLDPAERRSAMLRVIGAARRRLVLSLFRCDDFDILDALAAALQRGVKVEVLVTSRAKGWTKRLRELWGVLEGMGAKLYRSHDPVVKYHAKYIVADDGPALVASLNLTRKCLTSTVDFLLTTGDPVVVNGLRRLFVADSKRPEPARAARVGRVFCFFYVSIIFNPMDQADNMKKYGGFIPGIRPGKKTAEYLDRILTRLTFGGAIYLSIISVLPVLLISGLQIQRLPWIGETLDRVLPQFLTQGLNVKFYFGGTSLLIVVGVAMDTVQQIESQLIMRHYEGFMKGARIRGRRG